MSDILKRILDVEAKLEENSVTLERMEAKLDTLLAIFTEEVDDLPGDEYGLERDMSQAL